MRVLFDTNILARAAQPKHPLHRPAVESGDVLRARGHHPCVVPQVLYEFSVVCTRLESENGLGFAAARVDKEINMFRPPLFLFLEDVPEVFRTWRTLVVTNEVKGKPAHDARLVAAMVVHGIDALLTFNTPDFTRYDGIRVLDPRQVAASAS
jgi:predicted nucleic acid-binding protein